jgi:hypothetical protein
MAIAARDQKPLIEVVIEDDIMENQRVVITFQTSKADIKVVWKLICKQLTTSIQAIAF